MGTWSEQVPLAPEGKSRKRIRRRPRKSLKRYPRAYEKNKLPFWHSQNLQNDTLEHTKKTNPFEATKSLKRYPPSVRNKQIAPFRALPESVRPRTGTHKSNSHALKKSYIQPKILLPRRVLTPEMSNEQLNENMQPPQF